MFRKRISRIELRIDDFMIVYRGKYVMLVLVALLVMLAAYVYYQRSKPLLYSYVEKGNPVKEPVFAIFNPFRDRSPERSAEAFLENMRAGQCERAMVGVFGSPEHNQEVCRLEKGSPLSSWRMMNRTDQDEMVRMYYEVSRTTYDGHQGQLWVSLARHGADWKVTRYDCYY